MNHALSIKFQILETEIIHSNGIDSKIQDNTTTKQSLKFSLLIS